MSYKPVIHFLIFRIKNYDKFWDDIVELGTASKNITIPTLKRGGTSYYVKHLVNINIFNIS